MNINKTIIETKNSSCIFELSRHLNKHINNALSLNKTIIILCIGTDRATGDSLGPLVGEKLNFIKDNNIIVYGNLRTPVHAKNIRETIDMIYSKYKYPFIIAVDASLGNINNVGNIIIQEGPIKPGAALNKDLPTIGDLSIKGIVNIYSSFDFFILQNTRLFTVMNLANIISNSIYHCITNIHNASDSNLKLNL